MISNPFRFYQSPPPAPTYFGGTLPTVNVRASYPDDYVANAVRRGGSKFLGTTLGFMGQPQRDMVELFTGVEQTPSEAMEISNPVAEFLINSALDPLNAVGVTSIGGAMMRNSMRNPFRVFNLRNAKKLGSNASKQASKLNEAPSLDGAFKSEVDWSKWNPDTPNYPELIDEYNAIEESTKKAGTWMKNADGSPFEGTPEQFIQQQSSWFKKAFPNPVRKQRSDFYSNEISGGVNPETYFDENQPVQYNYHGSPNKFDFFDENKFSTGAFGKGIYTSKNSNPGYGENIYQLYLNANNPQPVTYTKPYDLFSADELNAVIKQKLVDYKNMHGFDFKGNPRDLLTYGEEMNKPRIRNKAGYQQLEPGRDYFNPAQEPTQSVVPFSNRPKSAKGNVGFFDMSNPNIYKALIPAFVAKYGIGKYYKDNNR